jgi:quercetin dioxygenase-like cupin family protein
VECWCGHPTAWVLTTQRCDAGACGSATGCTMTVHPRTRFLVTGTDEAGRSRVVREEVALDPVPAQPGFWLSDVFETSSLPPATNPAGPAPRLDLALAPGAVRWQVFQYAPGQSYEMHHTDTVDLDIVLAGSIDLVLGDGSHRLEAGDGAVINGVDHAWAASAEGARLSVVFLGTLPRI